MQWQAVIKKLPAAPGVYFFKDASGRILYVGKAINLRTRVISYKNTDLIKTRGPAIVAMLNKSRSLSFTTTDSEIEALLLEANLIRRLKPPYNSLGKDDKSAIFIAISWSEPFPRLSLRRDRELKQGVEKKGISRRRDRFFGPYLAAGSMPAALRAIRKIFPFRDCSDAKFITYQKLGRGCLYHQLGRCPAPCIAAISESDYRRQIGELISFLAGRKATLIRQTERQMRQAAKKEDFEQAVRLRDRLFRLNHLHEMATAGLLAGFTDRQPAKAGYLIEAYDISNIGGMFAAGSLVAARLHRTDSGWSSHPQNLAKERYRSFRIKSVVGANDPAMLAEVLSRRFRRARREPAAWALPDLIIVDGGAAQLTAARQTAKSLGVTTPIVAVAKGPSRRRADLFCRPTDRRRIPLNNEELTAAARLLREEAHRFAISYYRKLHRRSLTTSRKNRPKVR